MDIVLKVPLDLDYRLPAEQTALLVQKGEAVIAEVRREISRQFIMSAAAAHFPQGMTIPEARRFADVRRQLDGTGLTLLLDADGAAMLHRFFLSDDATETLRFKAEVAHWLCDWIDHLGHIYAQG